MENKCLLHDDVNRRLTACEKNIDVLYERDRATVINFVDLKASMLNIKDQMQVMEHTNKETKSELLEELKASANRNNKRADIVFAAIVSSVATGVIMLIVSLIALKLGIKV